MSKKSLIFTYFIIALAILVFFAVKYAAQWNMSRMVLFITPAVLITLVLMIRGGGHSFFWGKTGKARKVLETGLPGMATVTALDQHSRFASYRINMQPVLNLSLRVQPKGSLPYDVSFNALIPEYAIPQFQPGATFAVKIDRNDPNSVVFDNSPY